MSVDMEFIRILIARTVLSPARKIGGSYLYTMRAASEYAAIDTIQAFLGIYGQFWIWHYPLIYRVRGSAPDGSSPRDCAVLFKQWRIISKSLHYSPVFYSRENFSSCSRWELSTRRVYWVVLWTTHTTYPKWVTRILSSFSLSVVLTVGLHESRHQWRVLLPRVTFPENLKRFELFADDLTRHWPWVSYVIETRGPFPERKGLFFRGRDHAPLFTRVVGGDG